jgi:DNA-binding NtrC family response regulator
LVGSNSVTSAEDQSLLTSSNRIVSIVDDESDITVLFGDALSRIEGITIFTFTDPILALEHFQMNQDVYVLVITDFRMPGLNGIELLKKMKSMNKYVRTIVMTGYEIDNKMFYDYTKKQIIDGVIQKPIRIFDLIKEVNTQLHYYETQKVFPSK